MSTTSLLLWAAQQGSVPFEVHHKQITLIIQTMWLSQWQSGVFWDGTLCHWSSSYLHLKGL